MAVSITFYNYSGEPNRLNKTSDWALIKEINGTFQMPESITDPIIEIYEDIEDDGGKVLSANYMYISELNRYYFITNIETVRTNVWRVYGHVDVLMSYKDKILKLDGIAVRNEYDGNLYITDPLLTTYQYSETVVKEFVSNKDEDDEKIFTFDYNTDNCYLLTTG